MILFIAPKMPWAASTTDFLPSLFHLGRSSQTGSSSRVTVFPELEFYTFPLSAPARHQLSNIYKTRTAWSLADVIRRNSFNRDKGSYVPLAHDLYLVRKLPDISKTITPNSDSDRSPPFRATYFTNGLVIPENHDIYVIRTSLAPEQYAELNVIGQWLNITDKQVTNGY
jgi:hypothetical protein